MSDRVYRANCKHKKKKIGIRISVNFVICVFMRPTNCNTIYTKIISYFDNIVWRRKAWEKATSNYPTSCVIRMNKSRDSFALVGWFMNNLFLVTKFLWTTKIAFRWKFACWRWDFISACTELMHWLRFSK